MKKLTLIILACFSMIIAGCTTSGKTQHLPENKNKISKVSCQKSCFQRFETCSKKTGVKCRQCQIEGNKNAYARYRHYANEQCIKGAVIFREPNSMRDPLKCLKVSTNCCADLNVCLQYCKGTIYKQMLPAARCCNS